MLNTSHVPYKLYATCLMFTCQTQPRKASGVDTTLEERTLRKRVPCKAHIHALFQRCVKTQYSDALSSDLSTQDGGVDKMGDVDKMALDGC